MDSSNFSTAATAIATDGAACAWGIAACSLVETCRGTTLPRTRRTIEAATALTLAALPTV